MDITHLHAEIKSNDPKRVARAYMLASTQARCSAHCSTKEAGALVTVALMAADTLARLTLAEAMPTNTEPQSMLNPSRRGRRAPQES